MAQLIKIKERTGVQRQGEGIQDTVRALMALVPNGSISLIFLFQRFLISLFGTDKRWKKQK